MAEVDEIVDISCTLVPSSTPIEMLVAVPFDEIANMSSVSQNALHGPTSIVPGMEEVLMTDTKTPDPHPNPPDEKENQQNN